MYKYIHGFWKDKQKDYKKKLFLNHFKAVSVWKVSTWFKLLPKTKLTVKCIKLCEPQIKIWNKTCWYAKAVNSATSLFIKLLFSFEPFYCKNIFANLIFSFNSQSSCCQSEMPLICQSSLSQVSYILHLTSCNLLNVSVI